MIFYFIIIKLISIYVTYRTNTLTRIRCTNKTCVQELNSKNNTLYKKKYINRDTNSVLNMQKIIKTLIKTDTRPTNYINANRCV